MGGREQPLPLGGGTPGGFMMAAGEMVDTSFLISLASPARDNHVTARRYWRHFTEEQIPIYLSAIVVSESCVKQPMPPEILRCCVTLPFNWDDAIQTAKLDIGGFDRQGESRVTLKDDVKILAQAITKDAGFVITDDKNTFHRYAQRLIETGTAGFKTIALAEGFDRAHFDPNGQRDVHDALGDDSPDDEPVP